jgi:hypothetical protein
LIQPWIAPGSFTSHASFHHPPRQRRPRHRRPGARVFYSRDNPDGVAIFDALHRQGTLTEAMFYAFDLLHLDGEDLRALPFSDR